MTHSEHETFIEERHITDIDLSKVASPSFTALECQTIITCRCRGAGSLRIARDP
jgi:hypothetical protein